MKVYDSKGVDQFHAEIDCSYVEEEEDHHGSKDNFHAVAHNEESIDEGVFPHQYEPGDDVD